MNEQPVRVNVPGSSTTHKVLMFIGLGITVYLTVLASVAVLNFSVSIFAALRSIFVAIGFASVTAFLWRVAYRPDTFTQRNIGSYVLGVSSAIVISVLTTGVIQLGSL